MKNTKKWEDMAKKLERATVKCISCEHSYLMVRGDNPIIAECNGKRLVANTVRNCVRYSRSIGEKKINPMKTIK